MTTKSPATIEDLYLVPEDGKEVAHAEPAVPGWRIAVDDLFD